MSSGGDEKSGRSRSFSKSAASSRRKGEPSRTGTSQSYDGQDGDQSVPPFPPLTLDTSLDSALSSALDYSPHGTAHYTWRRPSGHSSSPRRPSSASTHWNRSETSSVSAHTASQSPGGISTPKLKSNSSRSRILASAGSFEGSPKRSPASPPASLYSRGPSFSAADGEPAAKAPMQFGKNTILSNATGGQSLMERKRRLASASGNAMFEDNSSESNGRSSLGDAFAWDQASTRSNISGGSSSGHNRFPKPSGVRPARLQSDPQQSPKSGNIATLDGVLHSRRNTDASIGAHSKLSSSSHDSANKRGSLRKTGSANLAEAAVLADVARIQTPETPTTSTATPSRSNTAPLILESPLVLGEEKTAEPLKVSNTQNERRSRPKNHRKSSTSEKLRNGMTSPASSASTSLPNRTSSLKTSKSSPASSAAKQTDSPSSSFKSVNDFMDVNEEPAAISSPPSEGKSQLDAHASRRQSTMSSAAGTAGAIALAAIRSNFGETEEQAEAEAGGVATKRAGGTVSEQMSQTTASTSGGPFRPVKNPMRSAESGAVNPQSRLSHEDSFDILADETRLISAVKLSPPRKSIEQLGMIDAVIHAESANIPTSNSQTSIHLPEVPSGRMVKSTSGMTLGSRASRSTLSLATEDGEGHDKIGDAPKTPKKKYQSLRRVTPPVIAMAFSKSGSGNAHRKSASVDSDSNAAVTATSMGVKKTSPSGETIRKANAESHEATSLLQSTEAPRKRSIFRRAGSGRDQSIPPVASDDAMSTKSKISMLRKGRKSEPLTAAITRIDDVQQANGHGEGHAATFDTSAISHKLDTHRQNAIRELVETERSYASDLAVIRDVYLARAKALLGFSLGSPLQASLSSQGTPIASPASANVHAAGYMNVKSTPPPQWSKSIQRKISLEGAANPLPGLQSSNTSTAGASSVVSNRSSTYTTSSYNSSDTSYPWPPSGSSVPGTPGAIQQSASFRHGGSPAPLQQQQKGALAKLQTSEVATPSNGPVSTFDAPLSVSDIRVIFANLEACCSLAQEMSAALSSATGSRTSDEEADSIGETFLGMIKNIESVYTAYCSRHEASMQRLQEVSAGSEKAAKFLRDCTEIAKKRTTAWDLGSLLIKPVQRVLKYALLLRQIVNATDASHLDYSNLVSALEQMQVVADKINQVKRRRDLAGYIIAGRDREASSGKGKKKKVLIPRSNSTAQEETLLGDDALDQAMDDYAQLIKMFDMLQSRVSVFGRQCYSWSNALRETYDAQIRMLNNLRKVYHLAETDEGSTMTSSAFKGPSPSCTEDGLVASYIKVIKNILERPWQQMDTEIHTAIVPMTSKILEMFQAPSHVISKCDEREANFQRCKTALRQEGIKSKLLDRKSIENANGYVAMQAQLIDELPVFLRGVQMLLDVGVQAFARLQAAHFDEVRNLTLEFWSKQAGRMNEIEMLDIPFAVEGGFKIAPSLRDLDTAKMYMENHQEIARWADGLSIIHASSSTGEMTVDDILDAEDSRPRRSHGMQQSFSSSPGQEMNTRNLSLGSSFGGHSGTFAPNNSRRPSAVAHLMRRTISGTFVRDTSPSPVVEPPLPDGATLHVESHKKVERQTSDLGERRISKPPLLPGFSFRSDGEVNGLFKQPSLEAISPKAKVVDLDSLRGRELTDSTDSGMQWRAQSLGADSTRSNSFVSAE